MINEQHSDFTRDDIVDSMRKVQQENPYLNCRLAVQLTVGRPSIESLPKISFSNIEIGDIIAWSNYRHFALWVGDGHIVQVGGWGESVAIEKYSEVLDYWGEPESFFQHPARIQSNHLA